MTVSELIERLQKAEPDIEVFVVTDGELRPLDPEFVGPSVDWFEIDCDPPLDEMS